MLISGVTCRQLAGEGAAMMRNSPLEVSEYNARIKCRVCEIFIGTGHFDAIPIRPPDGFGHLCRACNKAELRKQQPGWRTVVWAD